jgi:hypothetical protein
MQIKTSIHPYLLGDTHIPDESISLLKHLKKNQEIQGIIPQLCEIFSMHIPDELELQFRNYGRYTSVFIVGPGTGIEVIMQVGHRPTSENIGNTLLFDHKNLETLSRYVDFTPRIYGTGYLIDVLDRHDLPVVFTSFFRGYEEINYNFPYSGLGVTGLTAGDHFELNSGQMAAYDPDMKSYDLPESKLIMRNIIAMITEIYAKTYDSSTNKGLLVTDVVIDAGDFIIRPGRENGFPDLKLITARTVQEAYPHQLLHYLQADNDLFFFMDMVSSIGFYIRDDKDRYSTQYKGMMQGLKKIFGLRAYGMLGSWLRDAKENMADDLGNIMDGFRDGLTDEHDIPGAYRQGLHCLTKAFMVHNKIKYSESLEPLRDDRMREWMFPRYVEASENRLDKLRKAYWNPIRH